MEKQHQHCKHCGFVLEMIKEKELGSSGGAKFMVFLCPNKFCARLYALNQCFSECLTEVETKDEKK